MNKGDFEAAYKWLADAPLFIDDAQVDRLHDAVVFPIDRIISSTVQFGEQNQKKAGIEVTAKASGGVPLVVKGEAGGKASGELSSAALKNTSVVFQAVHTPQRQLVQIVSHYERTYEDRAVYVTDPGVPEWRNSVFIADLPRVLTCLDFPSQADAETRGLPPVKFIPMAAEFADRKIIALFSKLKSDAKEKPPKYEELSQDDEYRKKRRKYWAWFDKHFSATNAMELIEAQAAEHGRIQWIDFRVSVSTAGDTLHVHLVPDGKYDTGNIAYRLVKRGFRHGIRLVGTLQSGPDMRVLAVYDK